MILSVLVCLQTASAQEYEVISFEVKQNDMTARTNSRVDANGKKCAIVKVYADDSIAAVRGAVVGEIVCVGMEKQVYLAHDAKEMELVFENHFPISVVFMDYGVPSLTGQMTYTLKLQQNAVGGIVINTSPNTDYGSSQTNFLDINALKEQAENEYKNSNYAKAMELFMKISGEAFAQNYIGYMYYKGLGVAQNYEEALNWYRESADQNDSYGLRHLAYMYASGFGTEKNIIIAIRLYRVAANQGDAISQRILGDAYLKGYGVNKDYKEAENWYRKSAEQGNVKAQLSLGDLHNYGKGNFDVDYKKAEKWYRKAAEQGDAVGQNQLGWMYVKGNGVEKNPYEAMKWCKMSADQGYHYGQNSVGYMYHQGFGVKQDYVEAAKWYMLAAEQGNPYSQNYLGEFYEKGLGVEKDIDEAIKWYRKASEKNFKPAKDNLERCLLNN